MSRGFHPFSESEGAVAVVAVVRRALPASTVTVRKGAISVGQDGILRGDWQSPLKLPHKSTTSRGRAARQDALAIVGHAVATVTGKTFCARSMVRKRDETLSGIAWLLSQAPPKLSM